MPPRCSPVLDSHILGVLDLNHTLDFLVVCWVSSRRGRQREHRLPYPRDHCVYSVWTQLSVFRRWKGQMKGVRPLGRGGWSRENRCHRTPDCVPDFHTDYVLDCRILDLGPDYGPGCILDCFGRIHLDRAGRIHFDSASGVSHLAASVEQDSSRVSTRIRDPVLRPRGQENSCH